MSTTTTAATTHAIDWFEIPAADLDRAQRFYEAVLQQPMRRESAGPGTTLAIFPYEPGSGAGGCLYHATGANALQPSTQGALIYLNAGPSLDAATARAVAAGGRITTPRVDLPDGMGAFVHLVDSEGNRVGLHALT